MTATTLPPGAVEFATRERMRATRLLARLPREPEHLTAERRAVLWSISTPPARRPARAVPAGPVVLGGPHPATCTCRGSGWVCEDHPRIPYAADPHWACPCDAPGAPCSALAAS